MDQKTHLSADNKLMGTTLDIVLKLGLILGLILWCFLIIRPFILITLWGMVIAVTVYPLHNLLRIKLGNRKKLAAFMVTMLVLLIILVPFSLMAKTFFEGISSLTALVEGEKFFISPPPETVKTWPVIGDKVFQLWSSASQNLESFILQFKPQIKQFFIWFLGAAKRTSVESLKLIVSIIISGIFLASAEKSVYFIKELFTRIAGRRGEDLVESAEKTIRNVSLGIVGVALIQATLAGIGFMVAGVPGAGLLAFISLFLGIIQIGVLPVCLVVVIYMFVTAPTATAVALMIWCILIGPLDNVLKPIFLGRGTKSPMLVIFLGAIGGFLLNGLIGLFFGAVILSMGYNLFLEWLREPETVK